MKSFFSLTKIEEREWLFKIKSILVILLETILLTWLFKKIALCSFEELVEDTMRVWLLYRSSFFIFFPDTTDTRSGISMLFTHGIDIFCCVHPMWGIESTYLCGSSVSTLCSSCYKFVYIKTNIVLLNYHLYKKIAYCLYNVP